MAWHGVMCASSLGCGTSHDGSSGTKARLATAWGTSCSSVDSGPVFTTPSVHPRSRLSVEPPTQSPALAPMTPGRCDVTVDRTTSKELSP